MVHDGNSGGVAGGAATRGPTSGRDWRKPRVQRRGRAGDEPVSVCPSVYGGHNWQSTAYSPETGSLIIPLHQLCVDLVGRKVPMEEGHLTSVLSTAGGLAFVGDVDRYFKAFDVKTGKELWRTRLGAPVHGFPITYAANGKQYIAVTTGIGVFKLLTAKQSPDIYQPNGGNAIYVFELPD